MTPLTPELFPLAERILQYFWDRGEWPTVLELTIDQDIIVIEEQIRQLRLWMYGQVIVAALQSDEWVGINIAVISHLSIPPAQEIAEQYIACIESCQEPFRKNPRKAEIRAVDVLMRLFKRNPGNRGYPAELPRLRAFLVSGVEAPSIFAGLSPDGGGWTMTIGESMRYFLQVHTPEQYLQQRDRLIEQGRAQSKQILGNVTHQTNSPAPLALMTSPSIFISHSHQDDAIGQRLVGDLRKQFGDEAAWYDAAGGLKGGDEWWRRIVTELTRRNTFLAILSPDALTSPWVQKEMAIAYRQHVHEGMRLIPLLYRPCKFPVEWAEWELIQRIDFSQESSYPTALAKLFEAVGSGE